jgi:hypothetical protein
MSDVVYIGLRRPMPPMGSLDESSSEANPDTVSIMTRYPQSETSSMAGPFMWNAPSDTNAASHPAHVDDGTDDEGEFNLNSMNVTHRQPDGNVRPYTNYGDFDFVEPGVNPDDAYLISPSASDMGVNRSRMSKSRDISYSHNFKGVTGHSPGYTRRVDSPDNEVTFGSRVAQFQNQTGIDSDSKFTTVTGHSPDYRRPNIDASTLQQSKPLPMLTPRLASILGTQHVESLFSPDDEVSIRQDRQSRRLPEQNPAASPLRQSPRLQEQDPDVTVTRSGRSSRRPKQFGF